MGTFFPQAVLNLVQDQCSTQSRIYVGLNKLSNWCR